MGSALQALGLVLIGFVISTMFWNSGLVNKPQNSNDISIEKPSLSRSDPANANIRFMGDPVAQAMTFAHHLSADIDALESAPEDLYCVLAQNADNKYQIVKALATDDPLFERVIARYLETKESFRCDLR